jgi:2-polyprenyl-6-methoxyphenol hydroxylase-like FAD-dependent oxidoreductase
MCFRVSQAGCWSARSRAWATCKRSASSQLRARGIESLRQEIATAVPALSDSVEGLESTDDVMLLDIRINRLRRWSTEGLLCIGDAAHAMSPAGGVGINLAVQDPVAAASRLAKPLRQNRATTKDLAAVQRRRIWPTRVVQTGQVILHRLLMGRMAAGKQIKGGKTALSILARFPQLSMILEATDTHLRALTKRAYGFHTPMH